MPTYQPTGMRLSLSSTVAVVMTSYRSPKMPPQTWKNAYSFPTSTANSSISSTSTAPKPPAHPACRKKHGNRTVPSTPLILKRPVSSARSAVFKPTATYSAPENGAKSTPPTQILKLMWSMIFGTMPPWEVEEFGCLWVFLQQQYTEIFSEIAQEFPRNSHEWQSLRPTVDGMELFPSVDGDGSDGNDYNDYRNHLVSLGPSFLYKVLRQPSYEARRNLIACNAVSSKSSFMILVQVSRDPPSLLYPADKYESEDIGRTLPLMPAIEQPNSGWKHHWHGYGPIHRVREVVRSDNLQEPWIERTIGNSAGWQWGYAIWDEERNAAGHRL
ncbi:hypothetical protein F9C07_2084972 [Aspergillus flavus]|uniref:Uncharacterized protein n=1 Tax=Aspergillus flavus (strain ATCC 200026 / FGSC A1120 / IAM 13836 / NRRL 3357 / JCM 12722 / SRRC 167) TaxID=332952 RepID=A0A7U2MSS7_ASPFN|nr:hypothetical protein F9C07_2084972 [Aspergillus flavus]